MGELLKKSKLAHANNNSQAIDKANHHRVRHEADETAKFEYTEPIPLWYIPFAATVITASDIQDLRHSFSVDGMA